MGSYSNSAQVKIDENSWVVQIKEFLDVLQEEEEKEIKELSVSVFNVPKELMADNPEAYIPQMVSIGPCHHWRSELHDMETCKLATACRFQKRMNGMPKFQMVVVDEFIKYDWEIRSCYQKFIEYKEETLAWIMALDAVFLLDCLQSYVRHADQSSQADVKRLGRVIDSTGTTVSHNSIFRDLMMLENQLPLFLLKKLLELQLGSKDKAEERLFCLLSLVIQEFSPFTFKLTEDSVLRIHEERHMLEVLYFCLVPLSNNQIPIRFEKQKDGPYPEDLSGITIEEKIDSPDPEERSTVSRAFSLLWKTLSSVKVGPVRFLTKLLGRGLNARPAQFMMKLPLLHFLSTVKDEIKTEEESSVLIIPPSRLLKYNFSFSLVSCYI